MPDNDPLPIIGVSAVTVGQPSPGRATVIAVDAAGRPDVAGLRRAIEGTKILFIDARWYPTLQRPKATLLLSVTVRAPVLCNFRLLFDLPESRELLLSIIRAGRVIIATSPIRKGGSFDVTRAIPILTPDPGDVAKNTIAEVDGWGDGAE